MPLIERGLITAGLNWPSIDRHEDCYLAAEDVSTEVLNVAMSFAKFLPGRIAVSQ